MKAHVICTEEADEMEIRMYKETSTYILKSLTVMVDVKLNTELHEKGQKITLGPVDNCHQNPDRVICLDYINLKEENLLSDGRGKKC